MYMYIGKITLFGSSRPTIFLSPTAWSCTWQNIYFWEIQQDIWEIYKAIWVIQLDDNGQAATISHLFHVWVKLFEAKQSQSNMWYIQVNLDMTDHCTMDFCIWRTICLVPVRCISSNRHMYTTDFAYDGPIFLVPLSLVISKFTCINFLMCHNTSAHAVIVTATLVAK